MTPTPSKPDLVALADLLAAIEPLQDWTAQLHPKPEKYERYVAVLTKDQRDTIESALRHLASPSSYEAGQRDMRERAAQAADNALYTSGRMTFVQRNGWVALHKLVAAAISALPADGGEGKNDIQSSDGGGQVAPAKCAATGARPTDTSCTAEPEVAPGPSEANCSTCSGDGHIDVGAYRDVKCPDCGGTGSRTISVPGCCGQGTKSGECCGNAIETPGEEACQSCGGSGVAPSTDQRREEIARLWQDLLDKDDRTSPEEYPDMALITFEEFERLALDGGDR